MAWSLKTKKAVGVTVLTFGVVAVTTALHLAQLTRVVVQEARQQADLVAKQMYAQASRALAAAAQGEAPADVLRRDRVLRSLVDASIGYSPHLVYALMADRASWPSRRPSPSWTSCWPSIPCAASSPCTRAAAPTRR